jgi:hypothetical protein
MENALGQLLVTYISNHALLQPRMQAEAVQNAYGKTKHEVKVQAACLTSCTLHTQLALLHWSIVPSFCRDLMQLHSAAERASLPRVHSEGRPRHLGVPNRCFGGRQGRMTHVDHRIMVLTTKKKDIAAEEQEDTETNGHQALLSKRAAAALRLCSYCNRTAKPPRLQQSDARNIDGTWCRDMKTGYECNRAQLDLRSISFGQTLWECAKGAPRCVTPSETIGKAKSQSEVTSVGCTPKESTDSRWVLTCYSLPVA